MELRTRKDMLLLEQFTPLFKDLIAKRAFSVDLSTNFYANVQHQSPDIDKFVVTLAYYVGLPVAGQTASILGDTCVYLYGAAETGRNLNAAYLLQRDVNMRAKSLECRWYGLRGIDRIENSGVYRFKQRMGGEIYILGLYQKRAAGSMALPIKYGEKAYNFFKPYLVHS